jgi:hypothetical protein
MGALQLRGVPQQFGEIAERIGPVHLAGVNQIYEQIADSGAIQGLLEQ